MNFALNIYLLESCKTVRTQSFTFASFLKSKNIISFLRNSWLFEIVACECVCGWKYYTAAVCVCQRIEQLPAKKHSRFTAKSGQDALHGLPEAFVCKCVSECTLIPGALTMMSLLGYCFFNEIGCVWCVLCVVWGRL